MAVEADSADCGLMRLQRAEMRAGIPSASIGIPTRLIHSNVSIASAKDVELTLKLLEAALKGGSPTIHATLAPSPRI